MLRSANWSQQAETPTICYYLSGVIVVRDALPLLFVVVVVAVSCAFVYAVGVPITHCARQQRVGERGRETGTILAKLEQVRPGRQEGREAGRHRGCSALPLLPLECHISL